VTVEARPNRRVRKVDASCGDPGLSPGLLRGSPEGFSVVRVLDLVPLPLSPFPLWGICGDLSRTQQQDQICFLRRLKHLETNSTSVQRQMCLMGISVNILVWIHIWLFSFHMKFMIKFWNEKLKWISLKSHVRHNSYIYNLISFKYCVWNYSPSPWHELDDDYFTLTWTRGWLFYSDMNSRMIILLWHELDDDYF
jgi:hypothetical protein